MSHCVRTEKVKRTRSTSSSLSSNSSIQRNVNGNGEHEIESTCVVYDLWILIELVRGLLFGPLAMEGEHKYHFYDLIMNCCATLTLFSLTSNTKTRKMDPTRDGYRSLFHFVKVFYVKIKCECEFSGGDCPCDAIYIGVNEQQPTARRRRKGEQGISKFFS